MCLHVNHDMLSMSSVLSGFNGQCTWVHRVGRNGHAPHSAAPVQLVGEKEVRELGLAIGLARAEGGLSVSQPSGRANMIHPLCISILEVEPCGLGWRRFLKMPFVSPALATCCILLQHHANIIVFDTQQQVGSCFA